MKFTILFLLCVTAMGFGAEHARADCGHFTSGFDAAYCQSQVYMQADHDLNAAYDGLSKELNPGQKAMLRHGEIRWIRERDRQCSIKRSLGTYVNLDCATDMTRKRLDFIQARMRECTSTRCVSSKLGL